MNMNLRTLTLMAIAMAAQTAAMAAPTDTLTVRIKAMRCGDCAHKVRNALRQDKGVDQVQFNLERRTVTISYDAALTCPDSLRAHLTATKRYRPTDYSPADTIRRGFGLRMDDMFCGNCARRIQNRLEQITGIDSVAPHLDKHYVFIRYDANRTCKDTIRHALTTLGYTPVNYYTSQKISFAYYNIPAEAATQESIDEVLAIGGVEDANVNPRRKTMAVTFFNDETTADALLEAIRKAGIEAVVPPPHVCKEEQKP